MNSKTSITHDDNLRSRAWIVVFGLAAVEGLAALVYLASLPADAENALLLGFSARRLGLMAVLLAVSAACGLLAGARARLVGRDGWLKMAGQRRLLNVLLILLPVGTVFSALLPVVLMNLYRTSENYIYYAYYERLIPLLFWLGFVCLQGTVWLVWVGDFPWHALRFQQKVFRAAAIALGAFMGIWALIGLSGLGITPDQIGWGKPAVPLLEWQIWLVLMVGTGFLLFLAYRRWPSRRDWLLAGAIWVLAAGLWISQPVHTAFFATAGREPNYEIYPFSDGAYYGLFAQNVLIGNGFKGSEVPPRPFYITLLAGFHALAGQPYEQVIVLQTLLLAFLPVVLYFIGKELHSRPLGLMIALLAILRELTAMITSPITDKASTSQMFFADLPSALAISLWALLVLMWLKAPERRPLMPLWVGGGMGLAMLFRTQSVFMVPVVLLLTLLALNGRWKIWLAQVGLVLLGLVLLTAPWLWRNWQVTGQLAFDDPKSQTGVMAQRYKASEGDYDLASEYVIRPDENLKTFSERVNQGIFEYMLENPGEVAHFVSGHLINAEIDNLLLLPVRDKLTSPGELLMPSHAFWQSWDGSPARSQALLILLNVGIFALGAGAAWARQRWAGLALLLMCLSYNASNAIARNSGLRYLIPVDWMTYTYAAIGFLELAVGLLLVLGLPSDRLKTALTAHNEEPEANILPNWRTLVSGALLGLAFLLVGSIPVAAERAFPRRYPLQTQAEMAQEVLQNPSIQGAAVDLDALAQFSKQPGVQLVKGRALYPRYYEAGSGEPNTAKIGYEPLPFPRSLFLTASNTYNGLVMLRAEQPPRFLPDTADVIALGCTYTGYIDASVVLVLDPPGAVYVADQGIPTRCEPEGKD